MDDLTILQRIAKGDTEAFAGIVTRYQQPLFGFLGRMGFTQAQAEELAQDTFVKAWLNLAQFDPARAQFNTWLYTIAHRLALNQLASAEPQWMVHDDLADTLPSHQPNPQQQLEDKQQMAQLQKALRQLPTPDRSVLALVYVQGLSLTDVARIEGLSLAAVKTRLHRARHNLRDRLADPLHVPPTP